MSFGRIIKGVGSFYDVRTDAGELVRCRMRGVFRIKGLTPTVGDCVEFVSDADGTRITDILPRVSLMRRPAVANAVQNVIVIALKNPAISYLLLDKLLIESERSGLSTIICFNKCDLAKDGQIEYLKREYADCGAPLYFVSAQSGAGIAELDHALGDQITLFSGVSGAGKSSILSIITANSLETGTLSEKTQRGRHTTRHTELMVTANGKYVLDTPGFSSLTFTDLPPNELWRGYNEFREYSDCRYSSCVHINEPDCRVKEAVEKGLLSSLRYENYKAIYEEMKKNYKSY